MSQPNYDYATLRHVVETKFIVTESQSENPLQPSQPEIKTRKPHAPQYSLKNKRYECGCGFVGELLDFTILPVTSIPSRRTIKNLNKPQPITQYPRRNIKMIGSEIVVSWS